jgi:predicted AAA+ superfamily ATPase
LAFRLPVFAKRAKRKTTGHPKFFLFDAGVFRALRPRGALDRPQDIEGPALEGLVAQHLRAWIAYGEGRHELFFWRTRGGAEVDRERLLRDGVLCLPCEEFLKALVPGRSPGEF